MPGVDISPWPWRSRKMSQVYDTNTIPEEKMKWIASEMKVVPEKTTYYRGKWKVTKGKPIDLYAISGNRIKVPITLSRKILPSTSPIESVYINVNIGKKVTLREKQVSVAKEAMESLLRNNTITLALFTGFGKTIMSLYLASELGLPTLILCVGNILKKSWRTTLRDYFEVHYWVVGDKATGPANVVVCPLSRFNKLPIDYVEKFGTLILDEVHEMCTPTRASMMISTTPKYIIACTATPNRSNKMDVIHRSICGNKLISRPDARPLKIYRMATGIDPGVPGTQWENLLSSLYEDKRRNSYILHIIRANLHRKILVLTWRKNHGNHLVKLIEDAGISVDKVMGEKTDYKDSRVLVGTISKIGTGFDEKTACEDFGGERINLVIFLSSTKSKTLLTQAIGRGRRSEDPIIVYFVDDSSTIVKHWNVLRSVFPNAEYGLMTPNTMDQKLD